MRGTFFFFFLLLVLMGITVQPLFLFTVIKRNKEAAICYGMSVQAPYRPTPRITILSSGGGDEGRMNRCDRDHHDCIRRGVAKVFRNPPSRLGVLSVPTEIPHIFPQPFNGSLPPTCPHIIRISLTEPDVNCRFHSAAVILTVILTIFFVRAIFL